MNRVTIINFRKLIIWHARPMGNESKADLIRFNLEQFRCNLSCIHRFGLLNGGPMLQNANPPLVDVATPKLTRRFSLMEGDLTCFK